VLLNLWVTQPVVVLDDLVDVPRGLPLPALPSLDDVLYLLLPALSLAFVGLIQGAGVSAGVPNADGRRADASRDFIGQGVGNIAAGFFRGMPVGGSMSASSLIVAAGARTRLALFVAGIVMAIVLFAAAGLVAYVAMPSLAGLLIVVGIQTVKPSRVRSVVKTGPFQTAIMAVTFVLTLLIPLQYAVLVGVALGILLFVAQQSNRLSVRAVVVAEDGRMREVAPPAQVPAREVTVLQPYGSLFFASAPTLERQLPAVSRASERAVVIVRLRGTDQIGLAHIEVLRRYARQHDDAGGQLRLVVSEPEVIRQIEASGLLADIGPDHLVRGGEGVGEALRRTVADARAWIDA